MFQRARARGKASPYITSPAATESQRCTLAAFSGASGSQSLPGA